MKAKNLNGELTFEAETEEEQRLLNLFASIGMRGRCDYEFFLQFDGSELYGPKTLKLHRFEGK